MGSAASGDALKKTFNQAAREANDQLLDKFGVVQGETLKIVYTKVWGMFDALADAYGGPLALAAMVAFVEKEAANVDASTQASVEFGKIFGGLLAEQAAVFRDVKPSRTEDPAGYRVVE